MKKITLFLLTLCSILLFAQNSNNDRTVALPMTMTKNTQLIPTKIYKSLKEYKDAFAQLNALDPRVYGQVPLANAVRSQKFEVANATFDCMAADDFTVPVGEIWEIKNVAIDGYLQSNKNPDSYNVAFYANSGSLPGAVIRQENIQPSAGTASPNLSLGTSLLLQPGTYWMSVQAVIDYGTGDGWYWNTYADAVTLGSPYAFINPGNGFGTVCSPNWGIGTVCVATTFKDLSFSLNGHILSSCKTYTDKIVSTDPTQTSRVLRDGSSSVCSVSKTYPGDLPGTYHYKLYTIQNTSATPDCVAINTLNPDSNQIFTVAYNGAFNSANISQNYMGDTGNSPFNGSSTTMSVVIPGSSTMTLVVSEVVANTAFTSNYTIDIISANCSSILKAGEVAGSKVSIYPNPVRTLLYVNGMKMNEAKVYDTSGRLIPVKSTENQINVEGLTKGNYLLQVKDKSGKVHQDKFIKN